MFRNEEIVFLTKNRKLNNKHEGSLSVQSFINNISFPTSLEELRVFMYEHGCFNVDDILMNEEEVWTVPKWAKKGDICFFMHSKTAISTITALITELNKSNNYSKKEKDHMMKWLERGRKLHKVYGGKIFAVGRVSGTPVYENYQDDDTIPFHWNSKLYAHIDSIYLLENPINISEFNSFISITRGGAITGVFGDEFIKLRQVIESKNLLPRYVKESVSIPLPLNKINKDNWIKVAGEYRRSFFLEIQFRSFYVNYLLALLGNIKKYYSECRCQKTTNADSFVDNVIKYKGKYLSVEVKLDVNAERNIQSQVRKYCNVDKCFLSIKDTGSVITANEMWCDNCLVIDTEKVYMYDDSTTNLTPVYDLSDLKKISDIIHIKMIIDQHLR